MIIPRLRFVSILLILPKLTFAIAILELISASHRPSSDIRLSRYLKELTCLIASPFTWASTLSCSVLHHFRFTYVYHQSDCSTLLIQPINQLLQPFFCVCQQYRIICVSYIIDVSDIPSNCSISSMTNWEYRENKSSDRTHPCLTPFLYFDPVAPFIPDLNSRLLFPVKGWSTILHLPHLLQFSSVCLLVIRVSPDQMPSQNQQNTYRVLSASQWLVPLSS